MVSRRQPKKAKSFSYSLSADWTPYASMPTGDWIYHGTVTLEGVTGALAWRQGWFGIAVADHTVRDLGMWERIQIGEDIRGRAVAGWENVPTWPESRPSIDFREYLKGYNVQS